MVLHKQLTRLLFCACLSTPAWAGAETDGAGALACGRNLPSADAAASAAPLLAELNYTCLPLASGRQVWVGQAGQGHAEAVLLIHGLGNHAHRDWQPAIEPLARRFHVIAVDLPGFGDSSPLPGAYSFAALDSVLTQLLSQLGVDQVDLVGHSLGGAVALHFAHQHADQVGRLVLVDAAGILLRVVYAQQLARINARAVGIERIDRFFSDLDQRIGGVSKAVMSGADSRFDLSRWLIDNPLARNALIGRYTQLDAAFGLIEHDFSAAIRETGAPTTLIWGRDDPVAPLRIGELLAARMPDARLTVLDGVGHTPMSDSPAAFTALLLQALTEPLAPRTTPRQAPGDVRNTSCRNGADRLYTGSLGSLLIENCQRVRISNAQLSQLTLVNSSVTIENTLIANLKGDGVALDARNSEVSATAVYVKGRVAIRTQDSRFDLAGVSLRASERAVEMTTPSQLYFSVSDWESPEYTGDAHFAWPPGPVKN